MSNIGLDNFNNIDIAILLEPQRYIQFLVNTIEESERQNVEFWNSAQKLASKRKNSVHTVINEEATSENIDEDKNPSKNRKNYMQSYDQGNNFGNYYSDINPDSKSYFHNRSFS